MQVDIDHILFWMDAIRNSEDKDRVLESFWKGQVRSKTWLIEHLKPFVLSSVNIDIHGGWYGVLASLLFQSSIPVNTIRSIDIDAECEAIANTINKIEESQGKFVAMTADMCNVISNKDIVINTSCEHMSQEQYNTWLSKRSSDTLIVLQSNNYQIDEHIRIATSLDEFKTQSKLNVLWAGQLDLPLYSRFMIIGRI